jgi:hypothetical protein
VFIVVSVYFVIDSVRKLLDTPSYVIYAFRNFTTVVNRVDFISLGEFFLSFTVTAVDALYQYFVGHFLLPEVHLAYTTFR